MRRERRGASRGVSIRVARGLYHRPSTFRSRPIEWEETVHADTGIPGRTTKHIHFAGSQKRPVSATIGSWPSTPRRTGPGSCGTRRRRSPRPSGPATAGSPTTWPRSRDEPLTSLRAATSAPGGPRLSPAAGREIPEGESSMPQNGQPQPAEDGLNSLPFTQSKQKVAVLMGSGFA